MLKIKKVLVFTLSLTIFLNKVTLERASASDQRVIDVVSVTWVGAGALPGSMIEVQSQIDNDVKTR